MILFRGQKKDKIYFSCDTENAENSNAYVGVDYYDKNRERLDDNGLSNWKAYLAEHPLKVMTYLDTPIETDLSEAQIQAYKSLTTFKPTTIISNDAECHMKLTYKATGN